ncbi:MAG: M20/M25/M40 family metallo-hydrolase, partial [Acidobacteriota bacterium]|nr:M20/M25/M40 family metallo-hydrolase [Acidobacteriota bacterium]
IPGLVETSNNVAIVRVEGPQMEAVASSRSSLESARDGVLQQIASCADLAGFGVALTDSYPGWQPDLDSQALAVLRDVYTELSNGDTPAVTAVHAGLECGLLAERIPGVAMVSFGPTIRHAHSPDERVSIPSVARFWEALRRALHRFGKTES